MSVAINVRIYGDALHVTNLSFVPGDLEEPLLESLRREYEKATDTELGEPLGGPFATPIIRVEGEDRDEGYLLVVDRGATVGDLVGFFGPVLKDSPPRVTLDFGGRGGSEIVTLGLSAVRIVFGVLPKIHGKTMERMHAAERQAAGDWVDGGPLTMELRTFVCAQAYWDRKAFEQRFDLGRRDAALLLTEVGYERGRRENGTVFWYEPEQRERFFGGK